MCSSFTREYAHHNPLNGVRQRISDVPRLSYSLLKELHLKKSVTLVVRFTRL